MKNIFLFLLLSFSLMQCCKEKEHLVNLDGNYRFEFTHNSYWCKTVKVNGKDSIVYFGYYWCHSQPATFWTDAEIRRINDKEFKLCLDKRDNCDDTLFKSIFQFDGDTTDFGQFCWIVSNSHVTKMRGHWDGASFKGKFQNYHVNSMPDTKYPHDHIFIGSFIMTRK